MSAISTRPLALSLVSATLIAASLSGCGGSATTQDGKKIPDVATLYNDARKAAETATSGHVKGTATDNGEKANIELQGEADGDPNQVKIDGPETGKLEIVRVGQSAYVKGDTKALRKMGVPEVGIAGLSTKYIKGSASEMGQEDLALGKMVKEMFNMDGFSAVDKLMTTVTEDSVHGIPAYVVKDRVDSGASIYFTQDTHELLRIVVTGKDATDLVFTDWNKPVSVKAPAAKDTVEVP